MNNKYEFSFIGILTVIANIVFLTSIIIFDVTYNGLDGIRPITYTIIGLIILLTTLASFRKGTIGGGSLFAMVLAVCSATCLFMRTDNDKYFNRGVEYYNNGEYEKALYEFVLVKNYGPTEEYLETEIVVKLKGTDEYIVIKEDN